MSKEGMVPESTLRGWSYPSNPLFWARTTSVLSPLKCQWPQPAGFPWSQMHMLGVTQDSGLRGCIQGHNDGFCSDSNPLQLNFIIFWVFQSWAIILLLARELHTSHLGASTQITPLAPPNIFISTNGWRDWGWERRNDLTKVTLLDRGCEG